MAKIGFVMSMFLGVLGILLLAFGLLIQALLPKIGYMAFMIGGGSYSQDEYHMGIWFYLYLASALLCIVYGAILSDRFSKKISNSD